MRLEVPEFESPGRELGPLDAPTKNLDIMREAALPS
jgi:hypothetical protein